MKGKKIVLWIIVIILIAGVGAGVWYSKSKFSKDDSNSTKKVEKKKKDGKIEIKYETKNYNKNTNDKRITITNSLTLPVSISSDNGDKIVSYMKELRTEEWQEVKDETDHAIEEYDSDFQFEDSYGVVYKSTGVVYDKFITFTNTTSGGMGGTSWDETEYYNFDIESGEVLELEDICKDVKKCKTVMKENFLKRLEKDERFPLLEEDYEKGITDSIYTIGNFGFIKEGFTMVVQKYTIAAGSSGVFEYDIPYSEMNEYLKDEYQM